MPRWRRATRTTGRRLLSATTSRSGSPKKASALVGGGITCAVGSAVRSDHRITMLTRLHMYAGDGAPSDEADGGVADADFGHARTRPPASAAIIASRCQ